MNAAKKIKTYTLEDIYNLLDGQRAELMDGRIYMMSAPSTAHQLVYNFEIDFSEIEI